MSEKHEQSLFFFHSDFEVFILREGVRNFKLVYPFEHLTWDFRPFGLQAFGPLGLWLLGLLGLWVFRLLDLWTFGLLGFWVFRPSGFWVFRLSGF